MKVLPSIGAFLLGLIIGSSAERSAFADVARTNSSLQRDRSTAYARLLGEKRLEVARARLGARMLEGLRVGMTRGQVSRQRGFKVETAGQCAAWCRAHHTCCPKSMVLKYYAVRGKDPKAAYLRGALAGMPVRVTASFGDSGGLRTLVVVFTGYSKNRPLSSTPMAAYALKRYGRPTNSTAQASTLIFNTSFGSVSLYKRSGYTQCLCPRGSKCKCSGFPFVEYTMLLVASKTGSSGP